MRTGLRARETVAGRRFAHERIVLACAQKKEERTHISKRCPKFKESRFLERNAPARPEPRGRDSKTRASGWSQTVDAHTRRAYNNTPTAAHEQAA